MTTARILNFEEEKQKRLQEHLVGKCEQGKETEDEIELKQKQAAFRKQIAERAASNARIINELSKRKSPGRPHGPSGA